MIWYEDRDEVLTFARILLDLGVFEGEDEGEARALMYYFEKPYKWSDEHRVWELAGRPIDVSGCLERLGGTTCGRPVSDGIMCRFHFEAFSNTVGT